MGYKLYAKRDDRPLRRSALVFALKLLEYTPIPGDNLVIRAPVGWHFDSLCDFYTKRVEVDRATSTMTTRMTCTARRSTFRTCAPQFILICITQAPPHCMSCNS